MQCSDDGWAQGRVAHSTVDPAGAQSTVQALHGTPLQSAHPTSGPRHALLCLRNGNGTHTLTSPHTRARTRMNTHAPIHTHPPTHKHTHAHACTHMQASPTPRSACATCACTPCKVHPPSCRP